MNKNLFEEQKIFNENLVKLLLPKAEEEKIQLEAEKITLDFVHYLQELMEQKGWTKKDLAEKLGTFKSYISQLFQLISY